MPEQGATEKESRKDKLTPGRQEIEQHLEACLASPAFKGSPKCTEFLRFVVERCLNGETGGLHERAIAVDLLGKDPGFDPSDDASVRVKANEVRKRLARFYEASGGTESIRIELPVGGYVPTFHCRTPVQQAPPPAPAHSHSWRLWLVGSGMALLGLTAFVLFRWRQNLETPLDLFWRPVYSHRNPVILCLPGLRALAPQAGYALLASSR